MIFITAIESVLPIILLIALGYFLGAKNYFSEDFSGNISKWIMNIALPASIFTAVLKYLTRDKLVALSEGLLYGASAIVIGYLIAWFLVKILRVRAGRRGVFINTIVNANTIFIGLPLNIAMFGEISMPYFLVYYVLNTVSTWTFGVYLISIDSVEEKAKSHHFDWRKLLPAPLIGFLLSLVFLISTISVPRFVSSSLEYIGATVTPLSLLYIGLSLYKAGLKSIRFDKDTIAALVGKFVLSPLIMLVVLLAGQRFLPLPSAEEKTLILQSAVSALAVLPILANEAKGDVRFATNVVTASTVLFIIVVPIVDSLLSFL